MYGAAGPIPFQDIDCEIRPLVALLNQVPGVRTTSSCAGHSAPSAEAGIVFLVENQDVLHRLLSMLKPVLGWRGAFESNHPWWHSLWIRADLHEEAVVYSLKIDGYPLHAQRSLIGLTEAAISSGLPQATHRPSTMCDLARNADN